jgi:hypothetical protein
MAENGAALVRKLLEEKLRKRNIGFTDLTVQSYSLIVKTGDQSDDKHRIDAAKAAKLLREEGYRQCSHAWSGHANSWVAIGFLR